MLRVTVGSNVLPRQESSVQSLDLRALRTQLQYKGELRVERDLIKDAEDLHLAFLDMVDRILERSSERSSGDTSQVPSEMPSSAPQSSRREHPTRVEVRPEE